LQELFRKVGMMKHPLTKMAVAKAALHIIDLGKMAMPMVAIHINHFRSCSHLDSGLFHFGYFA
jgi:hypothetical protein